MKFGDIEDALIFVSSSFYGDNSAMICKSTGQICWASGTGGMDDIPEEAYDSDDWVAIPHKNDLGLGRDLAFEFIAKNLPDDSDRVRNFFHSRGAYTHYKELLKRRGVLQIWYDFEKARVEKAIREWCRDNGIEVTE